MKKFGISDLNNYTAYKSSSKILNWLLFFVTIYLKYSVTPHGPQKIVKGFNLQFNSLQSAS